MFCDVLSHATRSVKSIDPCSVIIFGITGDLTARKLMPALFNLYLQGLLPREFHCIGVARKEKNDEQMRQEMYDALETFSRTKPSQHLSAWQSFAKCLVYQQTQFDDDRGYQQLKIRLEGLEHESSRPCGRLFYFSTPPSFFPTIAQKLSSNGLIRKGQEEKPWSRIIIEKPFGHDIQSAIELDKHLSSILDESQIYRIDHYLGKDTVQNLLVLRFSNLIFESIWNHRYIDHVQISVVEDLGIGRRGAFFEEAGILRDFVQNHLMQLLSLVAMEPPVSLQATDIRGEKVKVLQALRTIPQDLVHEYAVRGQYMQGTIIGDSVPGYRQEKDVDPNSNVETYAAMRVEIDNWRWSGVPFYLRAGKRLAKRASHIAIVFKNVPSMLFHHAGHHLQNNALIIRIQPNDGLSLKMNCKVPDLSLAIRPISMDFDFDSLKHTPPEAYERLLCDCMLGDSTLFARRDEVLQSWKHLNPILEHWKHTKLGEHEFYTAGSMGPLATRDLLALRGHEWYEP